jgi:hypothetical protein
MALAPGGPKAVEILHRRKRVPPGGDPGTREGPGNRRLVRVPGTGGRHVMLGKPAARPSRVASRSDTTRAGRGPLHLIHGGGLVLFSAVSLRVEVAPPADPGVPPSSPAAIMGPPSRHRDIILLSTHFAADQHALTRGTRSAWSPPGGLRRPLPARRSRSQRPAAGPRCALSPRRSQADRIHWPGPRRRGPGPLVTIAVLAGAGAACDRGARGRPGPDGGHPAAIPHARPDAADRLIGSVLNAGMPPRLRADCIMVTACQYRWNYCR